MEPALIEAALRRGEGRLGQGGAFLVSTGKFTGRSPKDKFVVRTPSVEDEIWWDNNAPMAPEAFDRLHADMLEHMKGGEYFVQDLMAAPTRASPRRARGQRTGLAQPVHPPPAAPPRAEELDSFAPEFTIINCPSFKADPKSMAAAPTR
jgi:phosphoenolpyruvate carboxykinase (ATP)